MTSAPCLVTGAGGFIGRPVCAALLDQGIPVVGLDLQPHAMETPPGLTWISGSVANPQLLHQLFLEHHFGSVIHTGGISGPMLARETPYVVCEANVIGTIHLLEVCRQHGVRRLVHLSSAAAYGHTPPAPVPDDAPLRAKDLYGASKGAGDLLAEAYRHQYGLDVIGLRIANAYGPGRATRCAIRTMILDALAGRPTHFDWGADQSRPYLFIDDAVQAVLAAWNTRNARQYAYNISGAEWVPMPRIAELVREQLPDAEIRFQPGLDALGYRREALDLTAAERDLGFVPRIDIRTGIARTIQAMQHQPPEGARHGHC